MRRGGDLVSVTTEAENIFVSSLLNEMDHTCSGILQEAGASAGAGTSKGELSCGWLGLRWACSGVQCDTAHSVAIHLSPSDFKWEDGTKV